MSPQLAILLFRIAVKIFAAIQGAEWFKQGKAAAYAEQTDEARKRIAEADAARADVDAFATGELHDPRQRD